MKGCKKSKLSRYVLAALTVGMALGDTGYGFDTTIWRKNDTDGSTALVATTPMLQAFINKELDSQIAHEWCGGPDYQEDYYGYFG